ncbi:MAG: SRPBCC family protein [Actinomycetota bacterium]
MSAHEIPPVRLDIHLEVPPHRAYETFVGEFDRIKPREHNLLTVPIAETVFEARPGGAIFDRGVDGSVCRWGEVLYLDPPYRLVFAWLLDPDYSLVADRRDASEVEVRFIDVDGRSTRVELEHRHIERHGERAPSLRDDVAGNNGWPIYLHQFTMIIQEAAT